MAAQADPTNARLQKQPQSLFQGETLGGLLLEAYGFWKIGHTALYGAISSFVLAGAMLVLSVLGFVHLSRVTETDDLLVSRKARHPQRLPA